MRTQRNVTGIAVWLAFLSWMYLVAGMVSPSEVVAQNKVAWHVAQRVASAKIWEIPEIILGAIATNPHAAAEIVEHSITVRTAASETILGAALHAVPEAASQLTGVAVRVMSERQASVPAPTKTASQQVNRNQLNNQVVDLSGFNLFDPDDLEELEEQLQAAACQLLGEFATVGGTDFCVSPSN